MQPLLIIALVALLSCIALIQADPEVPTFPPASEYQMNVTYSPSFYQNIDIEMSGVMHFKNNKVAVESKDSLRTFENALFDGALLQVSQKFGEFPASCDKVKLNATGISFLPPMNFDASWFKQNAQYIGDAEGLAVFTVDPVPALVAGAQVQAQLEFNPQGQIVNIRQTVKPASGDAIKSLGQVSVVSVTSQDDALFQKPPSC